MNVAFDSASLRHRAALRPWIEIPDIPTCLPTDLPEALLSVRTRPLFVMRLDIVPNGSFEGERVSGDVFEGGSDWQALRIDGSTTRDVRVVLRTTDDALIGMTYRGIRHRSPEVVARLEAGEAVDPADDYFRTTPSFETASPAYDWLNRIVVVGVGYRRSDGPVYSIFEVL